jgi:toxin FitB
MSGFLIDTNVLSEYNRPGGPDPGVKFWLETTDRQLQYVSVITLAEIQKGIELLADGKRRVQLEEWLRRDLESWFLGRILPVDRRVANRWALLVAKGARTGRPLPAVDSLIAATADGP